MTNDEAGGYKGASGKPSPTLAAQEHWCKENGKALVSLENYL